MAKEKVLSSAKTTSSSTVKSEPKAAAAPKVDETQKYKDAISAIVKAKNDLASDTLNRNLRIALNQTITEAAKLI